MTKIIDAWMQHPTRRHPQHEMFASLPRWTHHETLTTSVPWPVPTCVDLWRQFANCAGGSPKGFVALRIVPWLQGS